MLPTDYREPPDLPSAFDTRNNLDEIFDKMQEEEIEGAIGLALRRDRPRSRCAVCAPRCSTSAR